MLKIENTETFGWEAAIRGMRNPKNSWEKSDSAYRATWCIADTASVSTRYMIGPNDLDLMRNLRNAGTDHRKFMRMIHVQMDVTAPLYLWKEASTYKVGTVSNSCSTMHKIHAKEFTLDDFSHEHIEELTGDDYNMAYALLLRTVDTLNYFRTRYLENKEKVYWWQMIQLLPSSYNQRRTLDLNYEVLRNIYHARRNHKLDEWRTFCAWIETLPYAEELICS